MAEVVTLTIDDVSLQTVVVGAEVIRFVDSSSATEVITIVDDAPDHGQMAGLGDDDHTQYVKFVVSAERPTSPRPGTMWIPTP